MFNTRPCPGLSTPCPSPSAQYICTIYSAHANTAHAHVMHAHVMHAHAVHSELPVTCQLLQLGWNAFYSGMSTQLRDRYPKAKIGMSLKITVTATCQLSPVIQEHHAQFLIKCNKICWRAAQLIIRDTPLLTNFFAIYTCIQYLAFCQLWDAWIYKK